MVLALHKSLVNELPSDSITKNSTIDFSLVKSLPFVVLSEGQELRSIFDSLCNDADFTPNIIAEVMGVTSAWAMARSGVGATLLPLQFVDSLNVDNDLSLFVVKNNLYSRQPVIATRKGHKLPPYVEYAIKILSEKD